MQPVGSALKNTLENIITQNAPLNGAHGHTKNLDGGDANSRTECLKSLENTGQALTLKAVDGKKTGLELGRTGAVGKETRQQDMKNILNRLPLPIKSWLICRADKGWQAKEPERTESLIGEARAVMADAWRHWRPSKDVGVEEKARLINAIMKMLSVYPYGALPSDPMQSKAKVEGFADVLGDMPIWAVEEACQQWCREESSPPTPVEILALAKRKRGGFETLYVSESGNQVLVYEAYEKAIKWIKGEKI